VDEIAAQIKPHLVTSTGGAARVGLPAVIGFGNAREVQERLQQSLGVPVFEIPTLPPSIPGMRLHQLLVKAIESAGGRVYDGMQAAGFEAENDRILQVTTEAAARQKAHRAARFILATGGILGGGLRTDYTGKAREAVFNLPLPALGERTHWLDEEFLSPEGHPIFRQGAHTSSDLRPVETSGSPVFANLQVVGGALEGAELVRERSLEGVALASAYHAFENRD
jgi:glycerol-3-phosphate dehydrogenase subunit B